MTGVLAAAAAVGVAKFSGLMTAANISTNVGFSQGSGGSLSPTAFAGGNIIQVLKITAGPSLQFQVNAGVNLGQNYFTSLLINGIQWLASAATYSFTSPNSEWSWSGNPGFSAGNSYPMIIY